MAVGDFWRFLAHDMTEDEISAGSYLNPNLFGLALIDVATGDSGSITLANVRSFFDLPVGQNRGDEFTDLIQSLNTIPGSAGFTGTKLITQERILDRIMGAARIGARQAKISGNPYNTGNKLRLRAKGLVTTAGGTPQGTLAV